MLHWTLDRPWTLARVCLGTVLWAFAFGMVAPVASLWLEDNGYSTTEIGCNTAVYFLGIVLAAGFVPTFMQRRGRACIVFGMIAVGFTYAGFPWISVPWALFAIRGLNGVGTAFSLVPLETLHSTHSSTERRARTLGIYAFSVGVGMAGGMLAGSELYTFTPHLTFLLAGCVAAASAVTFHFVLPADLTVVEEAGSEPVRAWQHPLSLSCAWCQGFLESGLFALLPVYLHGVGYSAEGGATLLSGAVLAGIAAQVPLAWLADRVGRRPVVYGCLVTGASALWVMPYFVGPVGLGFWLMLAGASGTALYPLGLAVMSERLPVGARARAGAWFLGVNCLGSLVGPAVSGVAMDWYGQSRLFLVGAVMLTAVLAGWTAWSALTAGKFQQHARDAEPESQRSAA